MRKTIFLFLIFSITVYFFSLTSVANVSSIVPKKVDQASVLTILRKLGNETHSVISGELINDFSNSVYTLYHLDPVGYIIMDDDSNEIVEASFLMNSPYEMYPIVGKKYYLGPMNYFVRKGNSYYNIMNDEKIDLRKEMKDNSIKLKERLKEKSSATSNRLTSSDPTLPGEGAYIDSNGWTLIDNDSYFRKLNYFPNNTLGTCGFVSLSMMLGYLDTFYNDKTVPNIPILVNGVSTSLISKGYTNYLPDQNNKITPDKWERSPGTTNGIHDLLFNYGHYYYYDGWDPFDWVDEGYGVTANLIAATFIDYRDDYIPYSSRLYYEMVRGTFFGTHVGPMNLINEGVPVNLTMSNFTYNTNQTGEYHNVIAYGYKEGMFLTHFGWGAKIPGSYQDTQGITSWSETIINSATIQSYIGIRYTGAVIKSKNVCIVGYTNVYVAGDGTIMYPTTPSC